MRIWRLILGCKRLTFLKVHSGLIIFQLKYLFIFVEFIVGVSSIMVVFRFVVLLTLGGVEH